MIDNINNILERIKNIKSTPKRFQNVYRNVIESLDMKYFLDKSYYRYDPIGSMSLDEVVDLCLKKNHFL